MLKFYDFDKEAIKALKPLQVLHLKVFDYLKVVILLGKTKSLHRSRGKAFDIFRGIPLH
jgi:hypothetical protein